MIGAAGILAHQGGWDEMLMVAGPIALFALAMRTANRRASRLAEKVRDAQGEDGEQHPGDPVDDVDTRSVRTAADRDTQR